MKKTRAAEPARRTDKENGIRIAVPGGRGVIWRKSRRGDIKRRATSVFLSLLFLVLAPLPALAQQRDQFYNGVRDGERGGNYYNQRDRARYRDRGRNQGGIGPGTVARRNN